MTRVGVVIGAIALATGAGGCGKDRGEAPAAGAAPGAGTSAATQAAGGATAAGVGRLHVMVSVDWEGAFLAEAGLDALEGFRRQLPGVPLTHFICPAYFTQPGANRETAASTIRDAVAAGDEVGIHIHAWRSLVEAAGVRYRATPSFLLPELLTFPHGDEGFEVELAAYTPAEIGRIVATSRALLTDAGLTVAPMFRAGGYIATAEILGVLAAQGITIDSSSGDPSFLEDEIVAGARLPARLREIWPKVDRTSQPFLIETAAGPILELPSFQVDYLTEAELVSELRRELAALAAAPARDRFVAIVFHQETADEFAPRAIAAVKTVRDESTSGVVFETTSAAAAAARRALAATPP